MVEVEVMEFIYWKSHQKLLVSIWLTLFEADVSNFPQVRLFSSQLRSYLSFLQSLAHLGWSSLLNWQLVSLYNVLFWRLRVFWCPVLDLWLAAVGFELCYELQTMMLLLLLLDLTHFLQFHPLDDLQFLFLLDLFLVLISLSHQLFHEVMDIFINYF